MSKLNAAILKLRMLIHNPNFFFSQTGEDILVNGVLQNQPCGFYVDVGAYDPVKYSNTFGFYLKGWNGINIDPSPEAFKKFKKARPNDINVNVGISDTPGKLTYYSFKEAAFNTFSKSLAESYKTPFDTSQIKVERLDRVLDACNIPASGIDLMSIDVEGMDLQVLKSNDWKRYRPRVIAVEFATGDDSIKKFLTKLKYRPVCNTILTQIYVDTNVFKPSGA